MQRQINQQCNDYEVVIIECCENCESHQSLTRHSEWKYCEQFNQLKKKIERYVPNVIVFKNPVPDELHKPAEFELGKNFYINKKTQQKIIYPRVGSFEIYIYNILVSSKLITNSWPNHYRILQTLNQIISVKNQGLPLNQFSVYISESTKNSQRQTSSEKKNKSPLNGSIPKLGSQKNRRSIVSRIKKPSDTNESTPDNRFRVNKSRETKLSSIDHSSVKKSTVLDPIAKEREKKKKISEMFNSKEKSNKRLVSQRYIESKTQNRMKFPSLKNSINILNQSQSINQNNQQHLSHKSKKLQERSIAYKTKNIAFNSIDQAFFNREQLSIIEKYNQFSRLLDTSQKGLSGRDNDMNRFHSLEICNNDESIVGIQQRKVSSVRKKYSVLFNGLKSKIEIHDQFVLPSENFDDFKDVENKSVQYSQKHFNIGQVMDRSVQYQSDKEQIKNLEIKSDKETAQNQVNSCFVQTDKVQFRSAEEEQQTKLKIIQILRESKPQMHDEQMQTYIILKTQSQYLETQTFKPEKIDKSVNTDHKQFANRGQQFPDKLLQTKHAQLHIETNTIDFHFKKKPTNLAIDSNKKIIQIDAQQGRKSLKGSIQFNLSQQPYLERYFSVSSILKGKKNTQLLKISSNDVIKLLVANSNMLFLSGDTGSGKSLFIKRTKQLLEQKGMYNVIYLSSIDRVKDCKKFIKNYFQNKKKNILLIDKIQSQQQGRLLLKFIKCIIEQKEIKHDMGYLLALEHEENFELLTIKLALIDRKDNSKQLNFIKLRILPLSDEDINLCISKTVYLKQIEDKDEIFNKKLQQMDERSTLRNALYLNLYCQDIKGKNQGKLKQNLTPYQISKWSIMKGTFARCQFNHKFLAETMSIQQQNLIDVQFALRQLIIKFHAINEAPERIAGPKNLDSDSKNRDDASKKLNQSKIGMILQLLDKFEVDLGEQSYNYLNLYPINCQQLIKLKTEQTSNIEGYTWQKQSNGKKLQRQNETIRMQELFIHEEFYNFLFIEAFAYYLSKGFRNLSIAIITKSKELLEMMREKANHQPSFMQELIQLVYDTQLYPALSDQASAVISLLCYLNYPFSNLIFDHCQIPNADLSFMTFYNCSFRNTNLINAILYKTSFLNCTFDSTLMENVNLLVKKYETEYTPLCFALSPDGKRIFLGCGNYIVILATDSGRQIKKVQAHLDIIRSLKFSKDGNNFISISDDKTIRKWDSQSFKSIVSKLPQKEGTIFFSNQSQTIATIVNQNEIMLRNIKSMSKQTLLQGHTYQITSVCFSTKGEYILTGSQDKTVRLWNLKGKQLHIYKSHQVQIICARISPTNAIVASSSRDKHFILFDSSMQQVISRKQFQSEIIEICLDLKQNFICVTFSNESSITVLSFATLQILHKLSGHTLEIISISFDQTFEKLLSLSKDRTVRLWDIAEIMKKQLPLKSLYQSQKIPPGPILSIAFNEKLKHYATGHQNGQINIWDDYTNMILYKLSDHLGHVSKLYYDSIGKLYSGGKDGSIRIWNYQQLYEKNKNPQKKIQLSSAEILEMKINEKNGIIAVSSDNDELIVYDLTLIKVIMQTKEEGKIFSIAFEEKGECMAVGGSEKFIIIYKIQNKNNNIQLSQCQQLGQHPGIITSLAYQGDSLLISVLKNGSICVWNHLKANLIKKIDSISLITCLSIYNRKFACLSYEDGKIRIINLEEGKQVKVFKYKEPCFQFITRNQTAQSQLPLLYAVCKDGNIMKLNLFGVNKTSQKQGFLPPLAEYMRRVKKFGRKAINYDGSLMVQVQGERTIRIKNLNIHSQQLMQLEKCPSIIEGVEFVKNPNISSIDSQKQQNSLKDVVLLLKSGQYWSLNSESLIEPSSNDDLTSNLLLLNQNNIERDLFYIKDKQQLFFKSGIQKISKQIKKPAQLIIGEFTIAS